MASYSDSLLVVLKPNRTACSILSPVGEVNYKPMPAPVCLEAPYTMSVHQPVSSEQVSSCGISVMKSAKAYSFFESLGLYWMPYSLIPLPNGPSLRTYQVYELCPVVEYQLAPQRDEPGSMGGVFGQLSRGLRQLVRGGYIWSPHRLRIC